MDDDDQRVDGIHVEALSRLVWVLRTQYPKVLEADRRFEEETGYRNKPGVNNLVDALSHIGTLFERAETASKDEQLANLTLFEDHLRRTMMEAWEQMIDFQTGEIDKLWYDQYLKIARPLQQSGKLHGPPSAELLDKKRKRYVRLLHQGRGFKRELGWEQWTAGTDKLIEACELASELRENVHEAIKAAEGHKLQARAFVRDNWGKVLAAAGILIALTFGIANLLLSEDDPPSGSTTQPTRTQPPPPMTTPQRAP